MRENLKNARKEKGLTQQQVADQLGISLVYYQKIEQGSRAGDFGIWDSLEDLFVIHQRKLREIVYTHPYIVNSQVIYQRYLLWKQGNLMMDSVRLVRIFDRHLRIFRVYQPCFVG